jgi:predicted ester cyclase
MSKSLIEDILNPTRPAGAYDDLLAEVLSAAREAMPDQTMTILAQAAEGDTVFTHWVLAGTHTGGDFLGQPATGAATRLEAVTVDVVRDGQIVEHNAVGGFSAFMAGFAGG